MYTLVNLPRSLYEVVPTANLSGGVDHSGMEGRPVRRRSDRTRTTPQHRVACDRITCKEVHSGKTAQQLVLLGAVVYQVGDPFVLEH